MTDKKELNECKGSINIYYPTTASHRSTKQSLSNPKISHYAMTTNVIDKFLRRYSSVQTKKSYKSALTRFFKTIEVDPQTYFESGRNYEEDVEIFADALRNNPPKTFFCYIGVVKKFYQRNDVELKSYFWEDLRTFVKGRRAITQDRPPTILEFKRILAHSNLRQKALYLTLASSGMRIGETTKITLDDIDLDKDPTRINIRAEYTKTGVARVCFISDEASSYVKEWLEHRQDYLDYSIKILNLPDKHGENKQTITKSNVDNRVFPFVTNCARIGLVRILNKTGLDLRDIRTKRYIIHIHTFRKFFSSRMTLSCPRDAIEMMMGHETGLSGAYLRFSENELGEMYKKSMHEVTIFESDTTGKLKDLEKEIERRDEKLAEIEDRTEFLKNLDKKDLAKLIAVLKGKSLEDVWEELEKRPKKWIKNIPEEEDI